MSYDRILLFLCLIISVIALIIASVSLSRHEEHEIITVSESSSNGLNAVTIQPYHNIEKVTKLTIATMLTPEQAACKKKCYNSAPLQTAYINCLHACGISPVVNPKSKLGPIQF